MDIAKLVLDYLTLVLSWPVVLGALVLYFLKRHGPAVNNILTRVNSLSFPGGVTLGTAVYPPEPTPATPPRPIDGPQFSPRVVDPIERLEKDFSGFIWQGLIANRSLVRLEIDRLWNQVMAGAFPLTILTGSQAQTHFEKLKVMKDIFKLNERAISDFDFLENLAKDKPRQELMSAYNKSNLLKWYLSDLSSRKS